MEYLTNSNLLINIDLIEKITGANRFFEVFYCTEDKEKHKIILNDVWDMRYSIENASIDRFYEFRKHLPEGIIENSFYIVMNSQYIDYFENQVSGTYPINSLKHYLFTDNVDTILDVLAIEEPIFVKI